MNRREQDAHEDLCRRLVTALNERDAARAEVARLRGAKASKSGHRTLLKRLSTLADALWEDA